VPAVTYTPVEIVRRGEEIYHRDIEPVVATDRAGYFVVLDIESGDFEIDKQDLAASIRLLARRPDAVVYGARIGCRSSYRLAAEPCERYPHDFGNGRRRGRSRRAAEC
jgi:hypothetical protein